MGTDPSVEKAQAVKEQYKAAKLAEEERRTEIPPGGKLRTWFAALFGSRDRGETSKQRYREIQRERRQAKAAHVDAKKEHELAKERLRAVRVEQREAKRSLKQSRGEAKMERRRSAELPDAQAAAAAMLDRAPGAPLDSYAEKVISQHGEDGITVEVLRRIGNGSRRAVEIGCGANGGNAGVLVAGLGFEALLLDGDQDLVEIAGKLFDSYPATVERAWITRDSVNELLAAHGFSDNLDYVGIDLDGVDYWIWEALEARPRMMICEYNAFFGPEAAVTVRYAPDFNRSLKDENEEFVLPKGYYGASLAALERLGRAKGYRLVGTVPGSENAVFVHETAATEDLPAVSAASSWQPRTKGDAAVPYGEAMYERIHDEGVLEYFASRGAPLVEVGETADSVAAGS